MTTTDEVALLSHIHANPLDHTGRMVLADYLQEQGRGGGAIALRIQTEPDEDRHRLDYATWMESTATKKCPGCNGRGWGKGGKWTYSPQTPKAPECPDCSGTGVVPDPVAAARAELIRVGCVLGQYPNASDTPQPHHMTPTSDWLKLRARERELLDRHATDFRKGANCERCDEYESGSVCHDCHGTGDAGGLTWRIHLDDPEDGLSPIDVRQPPRVVWVRGFPVVHCTLGECVTERLGAAGVVIRPSPWLLAVVKHHPGVSFRVTDREPFLGNFFDNGIERSWGNQSEAVGGSAAYPHRLPDEIFAMMTNYTRDDPESGWKSYPTADAAHTALGRAMWLWAWLHSTDST